MMRNPVYSREMKVSSRSIRLPLIIVLFNGILSMVTPVSYTHLTLPTTERV